MLVRKAKDFTICRMLTALIASTAIFSGCNKPAEIVAPGTLGAPVKVSGDLNVVLSQPESSNTDMYAVAFAALETSSVVFCKKGTKDTCDGSKTYDMTFQKRDQTGFYFISSKALSFIDGTDLLFVAYISNNGNKPSQKGYATFYEGKIESGDALDGVTDPDLVNVDPNPENISSDNGLNTNVLIDLFKQLLGGTTTGSTTTVPTTTQPTIPVPTTQSVTTPVTPGTTQSDALVPNPDNVTITASEFEVIRLTNAERQRQGKKPLIVQQKIILTSRESSRLMKQQNNMVHGLTSGWNGENIAMGYSSPQQVVTGWINSPGHYANMMGNFTYIGVGDTKEQGGTVYWTQQFNR